ncbi:hypothetical protein [Bradyrhizobium japonicum]|uniref:hypothetical protein n=1 Tax=Bradyrhizobium japonicum TaxID=375 RepID=UPI001BA830CF|nr:hypothetical protein [Bradyrhizobium japonicum]MBR0955857.1 hypothetical protein [Bradyrhizobium japonicum]
MRHTNSRFRAGRRAIGGDLTCVKSADGIGPYPELRAQLYPEAGIPVKVTKPIASIIRRISRTDIPSADEDDDRQLSLSAERRQVVDEYADNLRKIIRRLLGKPN